MFSDAQFREYHNVRRRLLIRLLQRKGTEQKEIIFHAADNITSWYHAVIGRFAHLIQCIDMLDTQDRETVLSILEIDPQMFTAVKELRRPFNMPCQLQFKVINTTEHLIAVMLRIDTSCPYFTGSPPYSPSSPTPYAECQLRNLFLYFTLEGRERCCRCITSITDAMASTIYAYQMMCLTISALDDGYIIAEILRVTGVQREKYDQTISLLQPFCEEKERAAC